MHDIDFNEVFGLESAKEPEVADPEDVDADIEESAKEPEVADPDEEEINDDEELLDEEDSGAQSPEENSKFAEYRRKMEKQKEDAVSEARKAAEQEIQKRLDEKIKSLGLIDPYTNKEITTAEEYDAYKDSRSRDAIESVKERAGLTDERFQEFVNELPEVKEARAKLKEAQAMTEDIRKIRMEETVKKQIGEISEFDPSIKSMEDILKMDNYSAFEQHVKRGLNFVEAYKLANFDKITGYKAEAGRQAAKNLAGKKHLSRTSARGGSSLADVPADVMQYYKLLNPEMSESDIRKHYNSLT